MLQRIEYRTGRGSDLFLLAADFNCPPDVLQDKAGEWLRRNRAVIVRPHNLPITCRSGESGSLIDYFIVSESLVGCVTKVWTDAATPWGPHYGVWIQLHGRPSEVMARAFVKQRVRPTPMQEATDPPPGPTAPATTQVKTDDNQNGSQSGQNQVSKDALWTWALNLANRNVPRFTRPEASGPDGRAVLDYTDKIGFTAEATCAGLRYDTWRHALLLYCHAVQDCGLTLGNATIGTTAPESVESFTSNVSVRRPSALPVFPRLPVAKMTHDRGRGGTNGHTRGGGGPIEVRLLNTLRHWMAALGKWSKRSNRTQNHMSAHIITLSARLICGVTATGRKLLDGLGQENATRLKNITIPIILGAWDLQQVDAAEAVRFIDTMRSEAVARSKERRRKDFDDWVADALGGTAKEAYRWVSLDSKSPPADLILTKDEGDRKVIISDPDEVANLHADPWYDRWECDKASDGDDELGLIGNRRTALLDSAQEYATHLDLAPRAIRMACKSFHKDTAIGVDDIDFHTIATLPDAALLMLGDLIRACVAHTALPHGAILVILNLLGKTGGRRAHDRHNGHSLQTHHEALWR